MRIDYFEWEKRFEPIKYDGSIYIELENYQSEVKKARLERRLWTRIDRNGELLIVNGKQIWLAIDYIVTEKPYEEDDEVIVFFADPVEDEETPKFKVEVTHVCKAWFIVEAEDKEAAKKKVKESCAVQSFIFQKSEAVDWEILDETDNVGKITKA